MLYLDWFFLLLFITEKKIVNNVPPEFVSPWIILTNAKIIFLYVKRKLFIFFSNFNLINNEVKIITDTKISKFNFEK